MYTYMVYKYVYIYMYVYLSIYNISIHLPIYLPTLPCMRLCLLANKHKYDMGKKYMDIGYI